MKHSSRWDIFCAVVDNYGDIGVCWRLARQLAREHGLQVRLWVDDLAPFAKLQSDADAAREEQHIDGVDVRHWPEVFPMTDAKDVADVVIEAFACELPEAYLDAMAARQEKPAWINLEYLSAEDWVNGAHGLASPHPRLPLTKHFFFPGFTPKTGGLIKEADYGKRLAAFDESAFRASLGMPLKREGELTLSLFGYENPALPGLLDAWAHNPQPITCLVPESRLLPDVRAFFGHHGKLMQRGHLSAHVIPFLPQQDYDALLWLCDLNFVRGEDSFVRAQWATKPFVWHIYPQADAAHRVKLNAFLSLYLEGLPEETASATRKFWQTWNEEGDPAAAWLKFHESLPRLHAHSQLWVERVTGFGDLANNLLWFVQGSTSQG
ncbi:MAG: elongation factor P maturation arginine rhamnosyltransferase EarP [Georgfuchsia sp.]